MTKQGPSSFSSFSDGWIYDVFVSFHGKDTRYSFTGNLCNDLELKGIKTFIDETRLKSGEQISPTLVKAIKESRIAIVVFSPNYASSSWCLDELVEIIKCMKEKMQLVIPIFYNVDPADVRHQKASFGSAMAVHEAKSRHSKEKLQKWRDALLEAANLSGKHFIPNGFKYEFEFIRGITEEISFKLKRSLLHVADYPVGLKSRISEVKSRLALKSNNDFQMVGIYGLGGIGKTTVARAVYNSIADQFEASCFLSGVRENSIKHGLVKLQETLLSDLLGEKRITIGDVSQGIPILKHRLQRKKVLLILDDVDKLKQLKSLAGGRHWFGSGTRIIITTRNKHLLTTHGVDRLYAMKELNDKEALQLFCLNAFHSREPDASYVEISNRVVQYAKGLPLALNIIGSDLFGKTIEEWISALEKYEKLPSKEILEVLKVSFDNLEDNEQEIFLDIACFFKGNLLEDVEKTLDVCRFFPRYGIGVLKDKSLVTIDEINRVQMHDLIQDLGRDIARKESPFDLGKRRRLWHDEDVLCVLKNNMGTEAIEGIMLDFPNMKQEVQLKPNAFERMPNLRILIFRNGRISTAPNHLPNNLKLLEWKDYPSPFLPADFQPEALVVLNMPHSHLTMNEPLKKFEHLTLMNLSNCDSITKLPDVSTTPNLTKVLASNCPNLTEIHDSVGFLDKLIILSAEGCPKLNKFPNGMRSTCLDSLNLGKCSSIQQFPDMLAKMGKISNIDIEGTAIQKFPTSIENLVGVEELVLKSCTILEDIPINSDMFQNLQELNVEGSPQLRKILGKSLVERLPNLNRLILRNCGLEDEDLELILRNFVKLKWLVLSENNFVTIPACIEDLANLALLHLENCKKLEKISVVPPYLEYIDARNCISLTPKSSNVLLQQAFHEVEYIDIVVFKKRIPKWFDLCREGGSVSFWVCRKFPAIAVFFLLEGQNETNNTLICDFHLLINGFQVYQTEREFLVDHVHLFDLRILLIGREWQGLNEHLENGWNHVQISCTVKNTTQLGTVKCCGIHLYKERMNIHDVSFINPDLHGSNLAYEDMDDALDIYDEDEDEEEDDDDVDNIFSLVLAKYFHKKEMAELMQNARSKKNKRADENVDEENGNDDLELEEPSTSINHQIPESNETETKSKEKAVLVYNSIAEEMQVNKPNKQILGSSSLVTSIQENEKTLELRRKGKLKEDFNVVQAQASVSTASTSTDRNAMLIESTHNCCDKANRSQIQVPEKRTNEEFSQIDDNMEAFYASIEAESSALSLPQNSLNTRPSEETQIKLQYLQDLILKKFSLLLHPGRSGHLKNVLEFLLTLSPKDGIPLRMGSAMLKLSTSFSQWSLDYNDASLKLESATATLSNVVNLQEGLETNIKEFREAETFENMASSQLANLEARKRELEEQINAIKAEIADFKSARDDAVQRKRKLYENGRMVQAEKDDLRNKVPRLRAEQEWARITQANIESEWSKLVQQFIESYTYGDFI